MVSQQAVLRAAVPAELRDWVDNRLISAHNRIVRLMVLGTLLNTAAILLVMFGAVDSALLTLFAASSAVAAYHRLWLAEGIERGRRRKRTAKIIQAYELSSLWLGLTLGIALALWIPGVAPGHKLLLAICGVTQIASAAYTIRTLPRSASIYIITQTVGLAVGLLREGSAAAVMAAIVAACASGLLMRMAFTARDLFVTRILADRELASSNRTVKLLLNEYEASGSDWLFEVDAQGALANVTPRFATAAMQPAGALEGHSFIDLFDADPLRDALAQAIDERKPLRQLIVRLAVPAGTTSRWWSISGRPSYAGGNDRIVYRGVISDVTGQQLAEHRANQMANFDALTGLPNRALFERTLCDMLDERGPNEFLALLHVDIDRFKAVNDEFGHPAGDAYLRAFAARLETDLLQSGLGGSRRLVARLVGDEFAILMSGEDACDQAVRLAERLASGAVASLDVDGIELPCSTSIGIALAPFHADNQQQLFSYAGIALSAAKRSGRGIWEMFEPGMDAELAERHALARDLRQAVGNGELRLFVQPLVDVATEASTGYEALLRWQHPERGLVPPDKFIPIAEESGLIVPIGEWVIRTALAEAASWSGDQTISINLSPLQFDSPNLLPVIVNALAETGIAPGRVEFEITEGVLLNNSEANIGLLNRLHDLGVKIALDDFGTGYASLNYLLTFPFDKIKIDRRFVNELATREESRAIVNAVITLANQLGMCTLAEGVEEREQLHQLRANGCRMVQGWLFGKAQPSEHYHPREIATLPEPAPRIPRRRRVARAPGYSTRRSA